MGVAPDNNISIVVMTKATRDKQCGDLVSPMLKYIGSSYGTGVYEYDPDRMRFSLCGTVVIVIMLIMHFPCECHFLILQS